MSSSYLVEVFIRDKITEEVVERVELGLITRLPSQKIEVWVNDKLVHECDDDDHP